MSTKVSTPSRLDEPVNYRSSLNLAPGYQWQIRKDVIDKLERLFDCRSPEQGLENVREYAGCRLVVQGRSAVKIVKQS